VGGFSSNTVTNFLVAKTIFILPLRTKRQAEKSDLSCSSVSVGDLTRFIKSTLKATRDCSMFLGGQLSCLDACIRHADGDESVLWSMSTSYELKQGDYPLGVLGNIGLRRCGTLCHLSRHDLVKPDSESLAYSLLLFR